MVSIDFSDDNTLYIAIGAGVAVILVVLLCCCCCCKRKKSKAAQANALPETPGPVVASVPPELPRGMSHKQASHKKQPSQKQYALDIDSSSSDHYHEYARMPTSPALDAPISGTVLEHPPHYFHQHNKAAVFEAPIVATAMSPMTTTAPNSLERTEGSSGPPARAPTHNSNSSGRSAQQQTDLATLVDDPAIVASRLPFESITTVRLISKGGFGEVHMGLYRGNTVAIKRLLPETRRDLKQIRSFFEEVKIMASMEHPHIVHFIGVAWDSYSDMSVVTEFMEGGDLRAALNEFDSVGRPLGFDKQKATIALHVAHALTYMHSLQPMVLHRDLKSKNILLDATQNVAKLTDFGISRERSDATMTGGVGTLLWMAPEVMAGERYDEKADVFSFGIVLSELDTYAMPYSDIKARLAAEEGRKLPDTALVQRIMTGRLRVSFSGALRPDVRALGEQCIALDPRDRPTAAMVLYELQKIERTMASEISIVL